MALAEWLGMITGARAAIGSRADLKAFIDSRAAFIAQKCITEFCRVRAGVQWTKLFQETAFLDALEASRWAGYAATLAQVVEMVEGVLRPQAGSERPQLRAALRALAQEIVENHARNSAAPASFRPLAGQLVAAQLDAAAAAPPRPVRIIPGSTFAVLFEAMPLAEIARGQDEDYIFNNLRMNLVAVHEEFLRRARVAEICRSLLAAPGTGQSCVDHL